VTLLTLSRLRAALLVVAALALLVGCGGGNSPSTSGALLPPSPTALPSFDPAKFHRLLVQLKGKPVVVNFWGSWCGPCIGEAPLLAAAATQYEGRVQFVGVDVQDDVPNARAFIRRFGWSYPSVFDPPASIEGSLGMSGQPVTIFFDAAGKQVFIRSGAVKDGEVQRELDKILGA
jgi:thiol-disulfide isomerase/thioredoxin